MTLAVLPSFDVDERNPEALLAVTRWLKGLHTTKDPLVGIIYLQSIRNKTVPSTAAKTVHILKKICGVQAFGNLLVTTTMWSQVAWGDAISREGVFCQRSDLWVPLIAAGSTVFRFAESGEEADEMLQKLLKKPPVVLQLQREVAVLQKPIGDTKAGATVSKYIKIAEEWRKDRKSKQHLLTPQAYFSRLQRLEVETAKGCQLQQLFPHRYHGRIPIQLARTISAVRSLEGGFNYPLKFPLEGVHGLKTAGPLREPFSLQGIMEGVVACFRRLQEENFCGDSFSIIVADHCRPGVVEVVPISTLVLTQLARLIDDATIASKGRNPNELSPSMESLELASDHTLSYLGFPSIGAKVSYLPRTTQLCLVLSVGLVSYAGSHASDFHRTCFGFSKPYTFDIAQFEDICGGISLQQEKLACLDSFVGGPVWVFRWTDDNTLREEPQTLSTSLRGLTDLWGPAWTVGYDETSNLIHHVTVERGVIYQPSSIDPAIKPCLRDGEVACHWQAWDQVDNTAWDAVPFSEDDQMLIGANLHKKDSQVNQDCPVEYRRLCKEFARKNPEFTLGTERQRHQLDVQTLSLQFSKVVTLGYQAGFKRMPGRTWKDMLLLEWSGDRPSPSTLDVLLGLEISACTGNGRRTRLWELFNLPGIQQFIKITMPDDLPDVDSPFPSFLDSFTEGFGRFQRRWVASNEFRRAARQIIRKVLQYLSYTGVDKDDWLRAWWADGNALRGFKINPKQHRWVGMLHDTEQTAVFATVSSNCIECLGPRRYGSVCSSKDQLKGGTILRTSIVLDPDFTRTEKEFEITNNNFGRAIDKNDHRAHIKHVRKQKSAIVEQPKSARSRRLTALEDELSHLGAKNSESARSKDCVSHKKPKARDNPTLISTREVPSHEGARTESSTGVDTIGQQSGYSEALGVRQSASPKCVQPPQSLCGSSLAATELRRTESHVNSSERERDEFTKENALHLHLRTHNKKEYLPIIPKNTMLRGKRRILQEGERIRLSGDDELVVRSEDFPQLVEWKSRGALRSVDGFIEKMLGEQGHLHRELLSEDVDDDMVFHVAVA